MEKNDSKLFDEGNILVPRKLINDTRLSDKARFIYCYIVARKETCIPDTAKLSKELGYSRRTLLKYLHELAAHDWIELLRHD